MGVAAFWLGALGLTAVAHGLDTPVAPAPPSIAVGATTAATPEAAGVRPLPASPPVRLDVAAAGVHTDLVTLGLRPDGTVEVPPHAARAESRAGWYRYSPTPGERGPSVLLGHVDSAQDGPAVFFELGAVRPGHTAEVTRADGSRALFRVTRVATHRKDRFPTEEVYGDRPGGELRLITCGGAFDRAAGSYTENVVVDAVLIGVTPDA
ncbi:class F sortase [Actinomycetospora lemnae]|uniref:Class F sortase n=1 Tax=Actinomycetospora lemnae TaxID=3019891 RepID=A0ABT5T128_9PSEU|nr:class F sortase [Actinomycetospora sp. DW7H6]MDD7968676.1 class F sortase [Actinomycetospora sp. DW7H6]